MAAEMEGRAHYESVQESYSTLPRCLGNPGKSTGIFMHGIYNILLLITDTLCVHEILHDSWFDSPGIHTCVV